MIAFHTLETFNQDGGIQKFNRCMLLALNSLYGKNLTGVSVHDLRYHVAYVPTASYVYFSGSYIRYLFWTLRTMYKTQVYIWGHVHFAPVFLFIKLFHPKSKHVLMAHGIEVWNLKSTIQRFFLMQVNQIWCVSHFTKEKLAQQGIPVHRRCKIFPNTMDPLLFVPTKIGKRTYFFEWEKITNRKKVLSLTRINHHEGYKGYDVVLKSMQYTNDKTWIYVLAGKYSAEEAERIWNLAHALNVQDRLVMPGRIDDTHLHDLYQSVDAFVLPSKKEGFGIVFIEALYFGLPVLAGNKDGSVDALLGGELGILVDPDDVQAVARTIDDFLYNNTSNLERKNKIFKTLEANFGFEKYCERVQSNLETLSASKEM